MGRQHAKPLRYSSFGRSAAGAALIWTKWRGSRSYCSTSISYRGRLFGYGRARLVSCHFFRGSTAYPTLDSFWSLDRALLEPGGPSYETKRLLRCKVNYLSRSTQTLVARQVPLHDKSCSRRPLDSSTLIPSYFGQLPKSLKATRLRQL
jgi:hypothetical protein